MTPLIMDRIVVDTSVVISALIGKEGPSREVLRQCLMGIYQPLISTTLFLEYEAVIQRDEIQHLCPLTDAEIQQLLAAFCSTCEWIQIHYLWRPNLQDESDNFLIELAVAGNAKNIVTNNIKDLSNAELQFDDLNITRPEDLIGGRKCPH